MLYMYVCPYQCFIDFRSDLYVDVACIRPETSILCIRSNLPPKSNYRNRKTKNSFIFIFSQLMGFCLNLYSASLMHSMLVKKKNGPQMVTGYMDCFLNSVFGLAICTIVKVHLWWSVISRIILDFIVKSLEFVIRSNFIQQQNGKIRICMCVCHAFFRILRHKTSINIP